MVVAVRGAAGASARLVAIFAIALGLDACGAHAAPSKPLTTAADHAPAAAQGEASAPVSSLRGPSFRYRFGVYLARAPGVDIERLLAAAVRRYGFQVAHQQIDERLPPTSTTVYLTQPPIEQFAPPGMQSMQFMAADLNEDERRRLGASRAVAVFEVVGPGPRAFVDYRKALELGYELARALGGFLWDEETRTAHTLESWRRRLASWEAGTPFVNEHVVLHEYRDGDLLRIVSLGMVKLGLPDVAVNRVAGKDADKLAKVVDLALQELVEGATPDAEQRLEVSLAQVRHSGMKQWLGAQLGPSGTASVVASLVPGELQEGDSDNRLLELSAPGDREHEQEQRTQMLTQFFGDERSVVYLEHDPELLAASERARRRAFALGERYREGSPDGERLLVKAPFETPAGGAEWMWVEVVRWRHDVIDGILTEDAFEIPGLEGGARVEVEAERIFDYLLYRDDGSREGNETQPLIEARATKRETGR